MRSESRSPDHPAAAAAPARRRVRRGHGPAVVSCAKQWRRDEQRSKSESLHCNPHVDVVASANVSRLRDAREERLPFGRRLLRLLYSSRTPTATSTPATLTSTGSRRSPPIVRRRARPATFRQTQTRRPAALCPRRSSCRRRSRTAAWSCRPAAVKTFFTSVEDFCGVVLMRIDARAILADREHARSPGLVVVAHRRRNRSPCARGRGR